MALSIILLIVGLALVVVGAEYLVDGSSSLARRFGMSEFIIGLTIVGMGTSAPEMVVSFIGAIEGNADVSIGNVVGSNIFNTLLILGLTALILPIGITSANLRRDIPVNIVVTLLLVVLGCKNKLFGAGFDGLGLVDGIVLLAIFVAYMWYSFVKDRPSSSDNPESAEKADKDRSVAISLLMVAGGLAALVFGGRMFVDNASLIATEIGVSQKFIAITVLAGGTSLPELATCVVAAAKKKGQLALGNIIGSNLFNIMLVLGGSALIHPLPFTGMTAVDLGVLVFSAVILLLSAWIGKRNKLDRVDGSVMLAVWLAYMTYLIINL